MNIKKKIKDLIPVLPEKDRPIAMNLLAKEDFQTLVELVDSDIQKAKIERDRHEKEENVEKVEETDLYISDMQALKIIVQSHIDEEEEFFHSLDTSARLMEDNYSEIETIDF